MKPKGRPTFTVSGEITQLMPVIYTDSGKRRRQVILLADGTGDKLAFTIWGDVYVAEEGARVQVELSTQVKAAYSDPQRYFTFLNAIDVHVVEDRSGE